MIKLNYYLVALLWLFLTNTNANSQNIIKNDFRSINGEEMLQKLKSLNLGTYTINQISKARTYKLIDADLFNAFGYDGMGQVGTDTLFIHDDIIGLQFLMLQSLQIKFSEYNDNQKLINQNVINLQNVEVENAKARMQVEFLNQKVSELESLIFDLRKKIEILETNATNAE